MYYVFGDYGYRTEVMLQSFKSRNDARDFFNKYTLRDLGGYSIVEMAAFDEDGEYIVYERVQSDDYSEKDYYYEDQTNSSDIE